MKAQVSETKFKIGDKVRVASTKERGTVKSINGRWVCVHFGERTYARLLERELRPVRA